MDLLSWWLPALVLGLTAPLWVRALADRVEADKKRRTAALVAQLRKDPESGTNK
jgi:hypothetical protein